MTPLPPSGELWRRTRIVTGEIITELQRAEETNDMAVRDEILASIQRKLSDHIDEASAIQRIIGELSE